MCNLQCSVDGIPENPCVAVYNNSMPETKTIRATFPITIGPNSLSWYILEAMDKNLRIYNEPGDDIMRRKHLIF